MHGRIRVKTSEEVQARIETEKEAKAKWYLATMDVIYRKRDSSEYDEELMNLTKAILTKQPDITTLWNIRKEALLKIRDSFEPDDQLTDASYKREQMTLLSNEELKLTVTCLLENPKSYPAWHHRCWILETMVPQADWEKELAVSARFLEADERNFHCWDYRQFVLSHLNKLPEDELEFITDLIMSNMSNYSAWHYRIKLLPLAYPSKGTDDDGEDVRRRFDSSLLMEEIKLIENAVYTDPLDESAWMYLRWILEYIPLRLQLIQAGYNDKNHLVWVVFNKTVSAEDVIFSGLNTENSSPWFSNGNSIASHVWLKHLNAEKPLKNQCVSIRNKYLVEEIELLDAVPRKPQFAPVYTKEDKECFLYLYNSCVNLLELEEKVKFVILSILELSRILRIEMDYSLFSKLKELDPLRRNYYSDLESKYRIENVLSTITDWKADFSVCNLNLTRLYHSHCLTLFQKVDLSGNPLGNEVMSQLKNLLCCQVLRLCDCGITEIGEFPSLDNLIELDISKNIIVTTDPTSLLRCGSLQIIRLSLQNSSPLCVGLRELSSIAIDFL